MARHEHGTYWLWDIQVTNSPRTTRKRLLIWGKTDRMGISEARGEPLMNPLLAHMLDVAACTGAVWDSYLAQTVRDRLVQALGANDARTARRNAMFYAALHDLGKASACFLLQFGRRRYDRSRLRSAGKKWLEHARGAGLPLPLRPDTAPWSRHEHITACHLPRLLGCTCPLCGGTGRKHHGLHTVALLLGGHHGHIPNLDDVHAASAAARPEEWDDDHHDMIATLARLLGVDLARLPDHTDFERPAARPLFAGLVVIADWIASDENRFTFRAFEETVDRIPGRPLEESIDRSVERWWQLSQAQAHTAVRELRLKAWKPTAMSWAQLFPDTPDPRPFQSAAMKGIPTRGPVLTIIESDTGSGKTRLALWCAHHLARTNGYHGLYTAMPTRAATDQAATDHSDFITRAFGETTDANLAIVHHTATATERVHRLLDAAQQETEPGDLNDLIAFIELTICQGEAAPRARTVLDPWYLRRCAGLLSTFGIGTADQVALSAQASRHWFLRLFGLANKTVIIDEAHAYELFQERLLGAAVSWLADAGASVVVLSATLPAAARQALIDAWCHGLRTAPRSTDTHGPITFVDQYGLITRTAPDVSPLEIHTRLDLVPDPGPEHLAEHILREARSGGVIAVLRNRVDSAHELHTHLLKKAEEHGWAPEEIILDHGQLLPRERLPRETGIRTSLGPGDDRTEPNPHRPARLVVVATQVIEQSLDLDFDRLYTDLAPIDLLIQRRGRLHRHTSNDPRRPENLRTPQMTVLWLPDPDNNRLPLVHASPDSRGNPDAHVYSPYTLAATHHLLRSRTALPACAECRSARTTNPAASVICLSTPRDSAALIESVYDPGHFPRTPLGTLLSETWEQWLDHLDHHENAAYARAIHPYNPDGSARDVSDLKSGSAHADGDDGYGDSGGRGLAARSRLAEPTTSVVVLFRHFDDNGAVRYTYDPEAGQQADLNDYSSQRTRAIRAAHRAQQRELLLNTFSMPDSWLRGLPAADKWPSLKKAKPLEHRHVVVIDPSGACVSGPVGYVRYSRDRGLYQVRR
ncbi:CRISPR-associated helicase Cas3' [Kitasatospora sp. NPDC056651]|uniref:CRISPR-associated helicase Cas3' n=1 Tax=Kitasatospora sp. NPDC056651 TaxID=3345892 RepID=UPI00369760F5